MRSCTRTCVEDCSPHGSCSGPPDYSCVCHRGWTGVDCSVDCGCNGHSSCSSGVGVCDQCQDYTAGARCHLCKEGAFGNATNPDVACRKCQVKTKVI